MTMDFLHGRRSVTLSKLERDTVVPMAQDKPLPTLPNMAPIENIPRNRTGSSTASDLIRRVSSMFSSRKKKPAGLKFAHANISKIYESRNSSLQSITDDEDDIRRPSGLGSAVSISSNRSLPPSPFNPTHPQHPGPDPSNTHSPFGYMRARAASTPNLLRSFSLRSKGSIKKKTKPSRGNSTTSHTDSQAHMPVPTNVHNAVTILSIPTETIAIILSYLPKSDVAQTGRTCRLFLHASRTVLYTHIDLGELNPVQLERFVAVLATRRDFTDLVRSLACETWPRFFMTTISGPSLSPTYSVASPTSPYTPIYHDPDPDTQHRNTLLTATFTLALQRMSNLISLTLPAYDHDLLAYHTAFGLRSITFMCSSLPREEANELFAWLDGQTNITTLLFPNLAQDYDYGLPRDTQNTTSRSRSPARPATSSGLLTQNQNQNQNRGQNQGKKYLVAPYLVPLQPTTSPTTPSHRPPSPSPSPAPKPKLSPRPKTAAPSSPSYAHMTFSSSASSSGSRESASLCSRSPLPSPNSHIPFPSSTSSGSINRHSNPIVSPITPNFTPLQPVTSHIVNVNPPTHAPTIIQHPTPPLTLPTLLPNLTTLHGPPSLIVALSSPPSPTTNGANVLTATNRARPRPLKTITLNISSTLYTGLRPTMIVNRLVGVTRSLGLRFGETVDRRTVEKVLGAAGSALGGTRSGDDQKREGKEGALGKGYKFGEGEWKGLIQLEIGFVVGGPGSDEALHRMISSAIPRYPYLRVLILSYTPTPIPASASNQTTLTLPSLSSASSTNLLIPSSLLGQITSAPGASPPLTPVPSILSDPKRQSDGSISLSVGSGWSSGKGKELSPPERAYVRQWTKHCPDLERVVFLSGGEWRRR